MWQPRNISGRLWALAVLVTGCADGTLTDPDRTTPRNLGGAVQPGAGTNQLGFYWLPPTVKAHPTFSGIFDASRQPVVRVVCQGATGPTCPQVVRLDGASSGSSKVKVDPDAEAYVAVWQSLPTLQLGPGKYRLEVSEGDQLLGRADLHVVATQSAANNVPAGEIAVVRGAPFPIKFRIESGAEPPPPVPPTPPACRECLEIAPGALLLPQVGSQGRLVAYFVDAQGTRTLANATFSSAQPGVVSVTGAGQATAVSLGSTRVTAQAGGLTSSPIMAIVAAPTAGALLLADADVAGWPVPVDELAPYGIGYRYVIQVRTTPPTIGQMVIGTGGLPILGRAVRVGALAGGLSEVELELRPLPEAFVDLSAGDAGRLSGPAMPTPAAGPSGLRGAAGLGRPAAAPGSGSFALGPLTCEATAGINVGPSQFDLSNTTTDATYSVDYTYHIAGGRLVAFQVVSQITTDLRFTLKAAVAWEGEIECKKELAKPRLPISGFLSLILTPEIPIGLGLGFEGRIQMADAGFEASLHGVHRSAMGYFCPSADGVCTTVWDGGEATDFTPSFRPLLPGLSDQRVEVEVAGFAYAEVKLINPLVSAVAGALGQHAEIKFLEVHGGVKQSLDVATAQAQAEDPGFAAAGALAVYYEGKAEVSVDLLSILSLTLVDFEPFGNDFPISRTPGGYAVAPDRVRAGTEEDPNSFFVHFTLDPATYFGMYAVHDVVVYSHDGHSMTEECRQTPALSGQQEIDCEVTVTEADEGTRSYYAFVTPRVFGLTMPLPFEVEEHSLVTVEVLPPCPAPTTSSGASGSAAAPQAADEETCGRVIEGDVTVASDAELADLADVFGITGSLTIQAGVASPDLGELAALEYVGEMFSIQGQQTTLTGLANLRSVRRLFLGSNTLRDVHGLEGVQDVLQLFLTGTSLTNLDGLRNLRKALLLYLENLPVTSLGALAGVQIGATDLPTSGGFQPGLVVSRLSALTTLSELVPLPANFPGYVSIGDNPLLRDVAVLRQTTHVLNLSIFVNNSLDDITGLGALTRVTNSFTLQGPAITSVETISNLASVGQLSLSPDEHPRVFRLPALAEAGGISIERGIRSRRLQLASCPHADLVQFDFPALVAGNLLLNEYWNGTACQYDFSAPQLAAGEISGGGNSGSRAGIGLRNLAVGAMVNGGDVLLTDLPHLRAITFGGAGSLAGLTLSRNPAMTSVTGLSGTIRGSLFILSNSSYEQCAGIALANGLTVLGNTQVRFNANVSPSCPDLVVIR